MAIDGHHWSNRERTCNTEAHMQMQRSACAMTTFLATCVILDTMAEQAMGRCAP
jgi:hypothetical protein